MHAYACVWSVNDRVCESLLGREKWNGKISNRVHWLLLFCLFVAHSAFFMPSLTSQRFNQLSCPIYFLYLYLCALHLVCNVQTHYPKVKGSVTDPIICRDASFQVWKRKLLSQMHFEHIAYQKVPKGMPSEIYHATSFMF